MAVNLVARKIGKVKMSKMARFNSMLGEMTGLNTFFPIGNFIHDLPRKFYKESAK